MMPSVDERRCAALSRHLDRFDTERGPAPVDMRVEIDQPRHDEQPAHIDNLGAAGGEVAPDFGYLSVAEGDVGRLVAPARRVDDAAASADQNRHISEARGTVNEGEVRGRRPLPL